MTGTTEQAPESGVKGSTAGTAPPDGAAEVAESESAETLMGDLDGIGADALLQNVAGANGAALPRPRPRVVSMPVSVGSGNGDAQATDPVAPYLKEIGRGLAAFARARGTLRTKDRGRTRSSCRAGRPQGIGDLREPRLRGAPSRRAGDPRRFRSQGSAHRSELAPGGLYREALPQSGNGLLGPHPGRQSRIDARG